LPKIHGVEGSIGNFELTVSDSNNNDICDWATTVEPDGSFTTGSTTAAMVDSSAGICEVDITSPGVWFQFNGTGDILTVNTCFQTNFDSKISVFEGSCDNLVCVGGNDDFCGLQSSVSVDSQAGRSYYVLVHGFEDETGFFTLNVATEENLSANYCSIARALNPGERVIGNTEFAEPEPLDLDSCDPSVTLNGPTLWYSVVGTGSTFAVSSCDPETTLDTQITVFSGECAGLICEDGSRTNTCGAKSEFSWQSVPFEQYFIMVGALMSLNDIIMGGMCSHCVFFWLTPRRFPGATVKLGRSAFLSMNLVMHLPSEHVRTLRGHFLSMIQYI
jgi:hypothetical protein